MGASVRVNRAVLSSFLAEAARIIRDRIIEDHLLGQGTIYPDTIETGGTKRADTIKTHHNRVPIIEEMIVAEESAMLGSPGGVRPSRASDSDRSRSTSRSDSSTSCPIACST